MPPLPPDIEAISWLIFFVVLLCIGLIAIISIFRYSSWAQPPNIGLSENLMRELLNKIRMLRKEMEELRREMRE